MNDVKSLVKSGDFVVYEWKGEDCVSLAIQRDGDDELIFADYPDGFAFFNRISDKAIKKIFRYDSSAYGVKEGFNGNFDEAYGEFIYDSENDVKEMTIKDLEEHFKCKIKIVK